MALIVTATAEMSIDGTVIQVTDTTGDYNVTTNPTGYGVDRVAGTISVITFSDVFTLANHGMVTNELVHITDLGSITGLDLDTAYYVIRIDANDFSLSASLNGGAVDVGGTVGSFDFVIGYPQTTAVARTYFETTAYATGTETYAVPLQSPPFIPNGTLVDTTTLTEENVVGSEGTGIIPTGVYSVDYIPTWSPSVSITNSGAATYTATGVDLSGLYAGFDKLYVIDGITTYRFNITSIVFSSGDTIITCNEAIHAGTFTTGEYFLGKSAQIVIAAIYLLNQCYLQQSAKTTKSDYQSACSNVTSKQLQIVNQIFSIIEGGLNAVISGDYADAQEVLEMGTKICTRLDADCGC
jgi:hypothetical protein